MLSGWKTVIFNTLMACIGFLNRAFPEAELPTEEQIVALFGSVESAVLALTVVGNLLIRAFTSGPIFGGSLLSFGKAKSPVLVSLLAGLLALMALSGCTTLRSQPTTSGLVVSYATAKVIEAGNTAGTRLERAQRIKAIAGEARTWLNGEGVTIEFLEAAARARLAKLDLSPADTMLANALVQVAVQELRVKIGAGVIPPDKLVTVNQLLGWIESAAALYGA